MTLPGEGYEMLKRNFGWKHCLGIGFEVVPPGQRGREFGHGDYTELMHKFELWLRDVRGITQPVYQVGVGSDTLRKEFFKATVQEHPDWWSISPLEPQGDGVYRCTGCQHSLDGTYLGYCH